MKMMKWFLVLAMAGCCWAGLVAAAADFPDLSAQALKEKMESGEPVFLLNPLSRLEFNEQHIPGSVNVPLQTIAESTLLPDDPERVIVTYCLGPK